MNTKLVESLAHIIRSFTPEERVELDEKIQPQQDWQIELQRLQELKDRIFDRRKGKDFEPPLEEYLWQTRSEQIEQQDQLIRDSFSNP